jgi:hypothetical protein
MASSIRVALQPQARGSCNGSALWLTETRQTKVAFHHENKQRSAPSYNAGGQDALLFLTQGEMQSLSVKREIVVTPPKVRFHASKLS